MKKYIKIAAIVLMLLAAAVYTLQSAGYLREGSDGGVQAETAAGVAAMGEGSSDAGMGSSKDLTEEAAGMQASEASGTSGESQESLQGRASEEPDETESLIMVHVCGCVVSPGVYEFGEGARLYEAIEAAGGFTQDADEAYMNLAAYISDGIKIYVPAKGEMSAQTDAAGAGYAQSGEVSADGGASGTGTSGGKIDINTADEAALQTLPGIGPSRAADIVSYRKKNGDFSTIEDIMKVPGIKEAAFSKIKDMIVAR